MRASFAATFGLALLATACSSSTSSTGTTTGGLVGATSTGGGGLPPGSACTYDGACATGICDLNGSGNCCASKCTVGDPICQATACDSTGTCVYPQPTTSCGSVCTNAMVTPNSCDGIGNCQVGNAGPCPANYGCGADGGCNSTCLASSQCASGFVCNGGACGTPIQNGACTENDACKSLICGVAGSGNCCNAACSTSNATCGASGCTFDGGACVFPANTVACGPAESCADGTQTAASLCDGQGNCPTPGTADCTPFICGTTACLKTCTTGADCTAGNFCDVTGGGCCGGLESLGTVAVDGVNGSDAACCGIGGQNPCLTLAHAMEIIDAAQANGVTITASLSGAGGNWPATETYPIVLGWDVQLKAPGVYFSLASDGGDLTVIDVTHYSANDTFGTASIIGSTSNPIWIGMDNLGHQSTPASTIGVEAGAQLSMAFANVNGSAINSTTAIRVEAGGSLTLGENMAATLFGVVNIGNSGGQHATDGYNGIVCGSGNNLGCTIADVPVGGGSVTIQGQERVDIDAEDFANVSLTSQPIIGVTPVAGPGFLTCPVKLDASARNGPAVLLNGKVTMTYQGTVQCIAGDGFDLQSSDNGSPILNITKGTIQNTELGIHALAGAATVINSVIQYNYNGVEQDGAATIDLSGGTTETQNTVVCASNAESAVGSAAPGIAVLNTSATNALNADNVSWDTPGPDLFSCPTLTSCVCEIGGCNVNPGSDGMDAVYESTSLVTTTGNQFSSLSCLIGTPCGEGNTCSGANSFCCNTVFEGCDACVANEIDCDNDCDD